MPLVLAAFCAAAVMASAALQTSSQQESPFYTAVAENGSVGATLLISSSPRPAQSPGGGGQRFLINAVVVRASSRGQVYDANATVLVTGSGSWGAVKAGDYVATAGTVQATEPGSELAAYFQAATSPEVVGRQSGLAGLAVSVRQAWTAAAANRWQRVDPNVAGLLPGMVSGERGTMPAGLGQDMKTVGLTHLTAVSGENCTLVLTAVVMLLRQLRARRWLVTPAALAVLAAFVAVVGPDPSVLRAAVMGGIGAMALLSGRPKRVGALLSCSVVVLLVADPFLATDFAFVLSALATLGLLLLGQRCAQWLDVWLPWWLSQAIAIPLAAQLFCAPAIVLLQPQLTLYAVPANIAAAPVIALVTTVGSLGMALALWCPWIAQACAVVSGLGAWWVSVAAHFFAHLPAAVVPWPPGFGGVLLMALLNVLMIGALWSAVNRKHLAAVLRRVARHLPQRYRGLLSFPMVAVLAGVGAGAWVLVLSSA